MSSKYWSNLVQQLDPYVPGEQPKVLNLIKLNTNENPYPPSSKVLDALSEDKLDLLRFYPDPNSTSLKKALAKNCGVSEQNVFVGNGSDEVLALAFMTFFKQPEPLLFADITYSFYPVYCNLYAIDSVQLPLKDDFSINLDDYARPNGGIIFPNPNAPTGIGLPLQNIEALLKTNTESVVIVDEAYIDFGGDSAVALIEHYPNLLVVQTLSKSRSLAGLRVGFAVGNAALIEGLNRVKNSFNSYPIDCIAEVAAVAALEDVDYFNQCRQKIITTRDRTMVQLQALGFEVLPSQANFIFAKPVKIDAADLFAQLRENNILVRYFPKPRIDQYLRITIGTDDEMKVLLDTLKTILGSM
ncbi:MAG: histidinol-phosphate transaminase [Pseudomonadales bacterium]